MHDKLHWLRVQQRTCIKNKLCLLVNKAFYQRSPSNIKELVVPVSQDATTRRLRSADTQSLIRPRTAKLIGDHGFFVAGPSVGYGMIYQFNLDKQDRSFLSSLYLKQNCSKSRTITSLLVAQIYNYQHCLAF